MTFTVLILSLFFAHEKTSFCYIFVKLTRLRGIFKAQNVAGLCLSVLVWCIFISFFWHCSKSREKVPASAAVAEICVRESAWHLVRQKPYSVRQRCTNCQLFRFSGWMEKRAISLFHLSSIFKIQFHANAAIASWPVWNHKETNIIILSQLDCCI